MCREYNLECNLGLRHCGLLGGGGVVTGFRLSTASQTHTRTHSHAIDIVPALCLGRSVVCHCVARFPHSLADPRASSPTFHRPALLVLSLSRAHRDHWSSRSLCRPARYRVDVPRSRSKDVQDCVLWRPRLVGNRRRALSPCLSGRCKLRSLTSCTPPPSPQYKSLGAPQVNRAYLQRALLDENVQYLLLALYWFLQVSACPVRSIAQSHTLTRFLGGGRNRNRSTSR